MSERLTVSLEDGIPDKLRTLAGGERKVGAYLSDVISWLWTQREELDKAGNLQELCIAPRVSGYTPQELQREMRQAYSSLLAQTLEAEQKRDEELELLSQKIAKLTSEMGYWKAAIESGQRLAPQEDSSSDNDTDRHA